VALTGGSRGPQAQGMDLMACSHYVDRVDKRDGAWRIARRTVITDWKANQPYDHNSPAPQPHWNVGRHDIGDPLYKERRDMGL
jgi:hypothetical protein